MVYELSIQKMFIQRRFDEEVICKTLVNSGFEI